MTDMRPEHRKTHIHLNLTRLPDYAAVRSEIETFLDADSRARIPTRWTLAVSTGRKVSFALVDSEVPNGARLVREAKVMMARDRAKKACQTEARPTKAKEKAKVVSGKHERYLKGTAITVGKGFFHVGKNPGQGWQRQKCRQS